MKNLPELKKIVVPAVAVLVGLAIGLGVGYFQLQKEQKISQGKVAEANRKVAYMQKKMAEEKNETVASVEQRCQGDMEALKKEKNVFAGQTATLKAQMKTLEAKSGEAAELYARTKKDLHELESKYAKAVQNSKDLDSALHKVTGEKQAVEAELKKTNQDLGHCNTNNAELCILADDLVKKYKNKGLGTVLLHNEPLTQIKKVELEHMTQQYQDEIERLKIKKK